MSQQFKNQVQLLFVKFEQGRGENGVPKTFVPYLPGTTKDFNAKPHINTLVKMAVSLLRAQCSDLVLGHGKDLMPGTDDEYSLHNIDGGKLLKVEDIRWETIEGMQVQRAELVLVWRDQSRLLMEMVTKSGLKRSIG